LNRSASSFAARKDSAGSGPQDQARVERRLLTQLIPKATHPIADQGRLAQCIGAALTARLFCWSSAVKNVKKKPRAARPRSLQYETLERREVMAASVTAALSGGVLNVYGTDADDAINFRQTSTKIYIAGVNGAWSASKVKSINVNLNGGNDTVSLNSWANGGNVGLVENVAIRAGLGNEKVRLASGQEVNFDGAGNSLYVTSAGVASINGTPLNLTNSPQITWANGVLTVTGTNGNDTINVLKAWNGYLAIQGVSGGWPASGVSSIVINLQEGTDNVSLDSLANGGSFELGVAVTVNSGIGNKQVTLPSGQPVGMAGYGHQLSVAANGSAMYDGVPLSITVPSTIQTSWANGVLTIAGTNGNDTLNLLKAWNNYIGIQGVSGAWPSSSVTAIVINLNDGNDYVSLNSLANGGSFELGIPVTVNSGAGNETVRLANGSDVVFSGAGHQLKVFTDGYVTLDGQVLFGSPPPPPPPPGNWFDTNIQDAALRTLGSSLYTDGLIDRSDIIALLQDSRDGSVLDATELSDLRRISDNTSLFGSNAYLSKLTSYVAYGTMANTNYQGGALGNLAAGATSTQMDKLVNKWFLGLDRPASGGTYRATAGTLFVSGAAYTDVKQGTVGDCYYLCALAEIAARSNSTITSMFVVNGDGTFGVKFYNTSGQAEYVTVDSYLPTNAGGTLIYGGYGSLYTNAGNELWVALAEKAYAQLNEFGWSRAGFSGSGQNSYAAIASGYISDALDHVTNQTATHTFTSGSTSFNTFVTAYNGGKLIGFASFATPVTAGVVGGHAYAVVGYDSVAQTVTLFNPWGIQYGLTTMSWSLIQQNFQYFDRTV
jgi:hypothetical protein